MGVRKACIFSNFFKKKERELYKEDRGMGVEKLVLNPLVTWKPSRKFLCIFRSHVIIPNPAAVFNAFNLVLDILLFLDFLKCNSILCIWEIFFKGLYLYHYKPSRNIFTYQLKWALNLHLIVIDFSAFFDALVLMLLTKLVTNCIKNCIICTTAKN